MLNLSAIVSELLARRKEMQQELGRLDRAIVALPGTRGTEWNKRETRWDSAQDVASRPEEDKPS